MSDTVGPANAVPARATTAGGLLRQARQAQGLHIAALAAAIKVVPRKLELLESDQFEQLPDATFTRALAQTVCRTLKIDAAPILALLPPPRGHRLEQIAEGLNTPFHERPGRLAPKEWASVTRPVVWIVGIIAVLTLAVYAMPAEWVQRSSAAVARPGLADPGAVPSAVVPTAPTATVPAPAASRESIDAMPPSASQPVVSVEPVAAAAVAASNVLQFRATAASWIDVTDAGGRSLISRVVEPGESVGIDGIMPMKIRIGNAKATQMAIRGEPLTLAAHTRDNVARLEIK